LVGWPTLRRQFWADIHDKEVSSAATYSYLWIADQMGHVGLGFLVGGIIVRVAIEFGLSQVWAAALAISAAIAIFGLWERSTYREKARQAGSLSVGEQRLLKHNAIIATIYMVLGAIATTAFLPPTVAWGLLILGACVVTAVLLAPWWLRQKIVWQKAALPYLARLADQRSTLSLEILDKVRAICEDLPTEGRKKHQLVIWGPFGVGKTPLAAAIGTEYAFWGRKVRYVTFDKLVRLAAADENEEGPSNIIYWDWRKADVLIIDEIDPGLERDYLDPQKFGELLENEFKSQETGKDQRQILKNCHTIWVLGIDKREKDAYIKVIKNITDATEHSLLEVELCGVPYLPWSPR
jgi:IstB-like ATP binding protein